MKKEIPGISQFILNGVLVASIGVVGLGGCSRDSQAQASASGTPILRPFTPDIPVPSAVGAYYPELAGSVVLSEGNLTIRSGTRIDWLNYTDYDFNPATAASLYNYFQSDIFKTDIIVGTFPYREREEPFLLFPRKDTPNKALFIVTNTAPYPANRTYAFDDKPMAATLLDNNSSQYTYLRATENVNLNLPVHVQLNKSLFVEACQMFAHVGVGKNLPSDAQVLAQELYCNSVGTAFYARQQGMNYQGYINFAEPIYYEVIKQGPLLMTESQFNSLPYIGNPFREKKR